MYLTVSKVRGTGKLKRMLKIEKESIVLLFETTMSWEKVSSGRSKRRSGKKKSICHETTETEI